MHVSGNTQWSTKVKSGSMKSQKLPLSVNFPWTWIYWPNANWHHSLHTYESSIFLWNLTYSKVSTSVWSSKPLLLLLFMSWRGKLEMEEEMEEAEENEWKALFSVANSSKCRFSRWFDHMCSYNHWQKSFDKGLLTL